MLTVPVSRMLKIRNRASILAESTILGVIVIVTAAVLLHYAQKKMFRVSGADKEISESVKAWKKDAELVVVGKVLGTFDKMSQASGQDGMELKGYGFINLAVEKVERGQYVGDTIKVSIGWFSNLSPVPLYPPFLKKDYHTGDRVRIFLYYDRDRFEYYTPAAYYTMEPLS